MKTVIWLAVVWVLGRVLGSILANEIKEWTPTAVSWLIRLAVRRLPEADRERYREEWSGHVAETPGVIGKYIVAVGFIFASRRMAAEAEDAGARTRRFFEVRSPGPVPIAALIAIGALGPFTGFLLSQAERPAFDGVNVPVPVQFVAGPGGSCLNTEPLIRGVRRGAKLNLSLTGRCVEVGSLQDAPIRDGVVTVAMTSNEQQPARSSEVRTHDGRRGFLVVIDTRTMNQTILSQELAHIIAGYTAIRAPFSTLLRPVSNAVLDVVIDGVLVLKTLNLTMFSFAGLFSLAALASFAVLRSQ